MGKEKVVEFLKELAGSVYISAQFKEEIEKHFKVIHLGGDDYYVPELDIRFRM